jgi:nicotinate phosphoribosyltransferase
MNRSALFTDFYELTMAQGYWKHGLDAPAVFDMFFRRQPFKGGFSVFAGLEPLLSALEGFRFSGDDLAWLATQKTFDPAFLHYLEDFRFSGDIYSVPEGEIVFPQEPLLRIHGGLIEAQIIEGLVLNTINFQSLIATKSARVAMATKGKSVMEFGLRRAQGFDGAMSASRASFIGGAASTSNTLAAKEFGMPAMGTMAHSWVMAFPTEKESFEAYAELYPDSTTFLIDTFDTLESGLPHAIEVGKRLAAEGKRFGVRLDSGDIDYLSRKVREKLDAAGLSNATIVVSNELDEEIIETLVAEGAPVDMWGVGTHLVTGGHEASFSGVYKLAAVERNGVLEPTMKFSDNPDKATNPGVKELYRLHDETGAAVADVMMLSGEAIERGRPVTVHHPSLDTRRFVYTPHGEIRALLGKVMVDGRRVGSMPGLDDIRAHRKDSLRSIDHTFLRFLNPHIYKVSISGGLREMKLDFLERYRNTMHAGR